jgi:3-hydroxy-3-methylglutaryl CoA synthase/uncharacterized OB-fold protein
MGHRYVARIGAYLPLLRLERKAAAAALRWAGLGGPRDGRRAVAGWDEDALTLAVEAARGAVGEARPADIAFASTSAPFFERAQASLLIEALALPDSTRSIDVAGSRRAGVSALLRALDGQGDALVVAGERRPTKPGSPSQLAYGDGAAAVLVGDSGAARFLGAATLSRDFVDIYASREHPAPYAAEERFVRDVAVAEALVPTIRNACGNAGIEAGRIAFAAVAEPVAGAYKAAASKLGLTAPNLAIDLSVAAGDLGAAHALFAFALACAQARPGDIILLAGFGSGCEALLFETTGEMPGAADAAALLGSGLPFADYVRFLSLTGSLELDWGVRAEFEQKAQPTVLERHGRDMMGFIGGRDLHGNVQFPKSRVPVNPDAAGPEPLADVRLADEIGKIVSITADRLNFTPDPPFNFGLVQFANGARVMMEFTDAGPSGFNVGDPVGMRFRIKSVDRKRGFRTYFWKAAPAERPQLETN